MSKLPILFVILFTAFSVVYAFEMEDGADKLDVLYGGVYGVQNDSTDTLQVGSIPRASVSYDEASVAGGGPPQPAVDSNLSEEQVLLAESFFNLSSVLIPFLVAIAITGLFIAVFFTVRNRRNRYDDE